MTTLTFHFVPNLMPDHPRLSTRARHEGSLEPRFHQPLVWSTLLAAPIYEQYKDDEPPSWRYHSWLLSARSRTQFYARHGLAGEPLAWILVEDGRIPENAIRGGTVSGSPVYICRAFHTPMGGSIQPGRVSRDVYASIGFADSEHVPPVYEVLVGDERAVQWIPWSGPYDREMQLKYRPVSGGMDLSHRPLYIAQADIYNNVLPGKCCGHLGGAWIPWSREELHVTDYRVLCYTAESDAWCSTCENAPSYAQPNDEDEMPGPSRYSRGRSRWFRRLRNIGRKLTVRS